VRRLIDVAAAQVTIVDRPRDVLFLLPPDVSAPVSHLAFRFPPLGPAVVAACVPSLRFRAFDLALDVYHRPLHDLRVAADADVVERHLRGERDERIELLTERILERIAERARACDLFAISVDRGSQIPLAALLSVRIKERWDKRIIVGGVAMEHLRNLLLRTEAMGADVVTTASTPGQIRRAFATLLELPEHRRGPPLESNSDVVVLVRGGMRKAPSAADWPMPDFSIYEISSYRRDVVRAQFPSATSYRGEVGESLALPYFFTFECQFSCAFCQSGGTQENKDIDDVVRELATLSELWETREFLFFDTQINLHARAFSEALLAARLDLRWSDSYRARPSEPGDLEVMARAGCASLTIGVESAAERVLKIMVKGHRPEHATQMIRQAHEHEILLRVNLLACYPGETAEELQMTRDWVRENAFAIDDLAPSSFYLTADSPIGRKPERHGIRIRGPRSLQHEGKFRKSPDSLMYDEIDGLTWEEREPLLELGEDSLRQAWLEGRGALRPFGGLSPSTMLALRRHFSKKSELHEFIVHCHDVGAQQELAGDAVEAPSNAVALRPTFLAPRTIRPALARAFVTALRVAQRSPSFFAREGDTLHAALFADGGFVAFRGRVERDASGIARTITVEQLVGDVVRMEASDPRAALLARGGRFEPLGMDAQRAGFVRFEIISFRLGTGQS
jgi:radical SAM superfamily enzyme YgiQ (UPF0313 family)